MPFPKNQIYCILDFETYSEAPLKKTGVFEYALHPSTDILCAAWKIGTRDELRKASVEFWAPGIPGLVDPLPGSNVGGLFSALMDKDVILVAHNAMFEQCIVKFVFAEKHFYSKREELNSIPHSRWICTASLARALAIPGSLEGAAKALLTGFEKDMAGNRLMLKWCKPRKPTKNNKNTRHNDLGEYKRIVDYCISDIDVETELFLKAPPLSDSEREIWLLDQKINSRGFYVDRPLIEKVLKFIDIEKERINKETSDLTFGVIESATQRDAVLAWLAAECVYLPDLQKKTIEDVLSNGEVKGVSEKILKFRQAISKTSTAKYQAFELRSRHDSRVRDTFIYHAASTGRWSGAGVQPQNLPRPDKSIPDSVLAANFVASNSLEDIESFLGDPMTVFSSCIRSVIMAPKGKVLDVADYSAIEARGVFWLAGAEYGLKSFREKRPIYEEMAARIFNKKPSEITKDGVERFVGKQATLGCGYAMGPTKFMATCESYGQIISEDLAKQAVNTYRETFPEVKRTWSNLNDAAIAAVENPGKIFPTNRTKWLFSNQFLWCLLPSNRKLAYYRPTIEYELTPWEELKPVLYYYSTNSLTKKFEKQKTHGGILTENVVQGFCRDILAAAKLRIENSGKWEVVLSVHDEIVGERKKGVGSNKEFCELMKTLPAWAKGFPIDAEGWECERYSK